MAPDRSDAHEHEIRGATFSAAAIGRNAVPWLIWASAAGEDLIASMWVFVLRPLDACTLAVNSVDKVIVSKNPIGQLVPQL